MNRAVEDILDYAERMDLTALEISVLNLKLQNLRREVEPKLDLAQAIHELRVDMDQFIYKDGALFAPEKEYYQIMQNLENLLHRIYGEVYES
tara:strand:- start:195 stop:470 length:276 start_codon:yes stop_codon:yes gene_type:complete